MAIRAMSVRCVVERTSMTERSTEVAVPPVFFPVRRPIVPTNRSNSQDLPTRYFQVSSPSQIFVLKGRRHNIHLRRRNPQRCCFLSPS
jgi:hypothetical protein